MIGMNLLLLPERFGFFAEQIISDLGNKCDISSHAGGGDSLVGSFSPGIHHKTPAEDCLSRHRNPSRLHHHIRIGTADNNNLFHGSPLQFIVF